MATRKRVYGVLLNILLFMTPGIGIAQAVFEIKKTTEQNANPDRAHFFWKRYNEIQPIIQKIRLAKQLIHTQADSAERLAWAIYRESIAIPDYEAVMQSLCINAIIQHNRGHFDSSTVLFKTAIPLTSYSGQNARPAIYINIANNYQAKGNYEEALVYNYRAIAAMNASKVALPSQNYIALFNNVTLLWSVLGETSRSLESLELLKKVCTKSTDPSALPLYYNALACVSPSLTVPQRLAYYQAIIKLSHPNNNRISCVNAFNKICEYYIEDSQTDSAKIYLNGALSVLSQYNTDFDNCFFYTYLNQARLLEIDGKDAAAGAVFSTIYNKADSLHFKDIMMLIQPKLAAFYSKTHAYQKAYEHMNSYAQLQNAVLTQQKTRSVENWTQARLAEKDKQILKKQLRISQQNRQIQHKNFWIMAITLCCLILGSVLANFIRSYRNRQKLQQSVIAQLHHVQEINQLKAQMRGEEQERSRIATDLHDGIASQLWAMKLNLDDVLKDNNGYSQQRLQGIYSHLDVVAQEIRQTAHNLMPGLLLEEGLSKALAALCNRIEKTGQLEVEFQEYGVIPELDMEIQLSMYRMIQELIQNVLKHAHATLLLVQLSCANHLLNITVEDNGSGLAAMDSKKGLGLRNIKRRVETLQGQFDLKSHPDKGTNIYMEFDIRCFPEVSAMA